MLLFSQHLFQRRVGFSDEGSFKYIFRAYKEGDLFSFVYKQRDEADTDIQHVDDEVLYPAVFSITECKKRERSAHIKQPIDNRNG